MQKVQIDFNQCPVGTLLSQWLSEQGLATAGVMLDGVRVRPDLMLAAQAQGKMLGYSDQPLEGPLEAAQVAPAPVCAS